MTKKHFIALAEAMRLEFPVTTDSAAAVDMYLRLERRIADFCDAQNKNFDRNRWLGYIRGENGPSDSMRMGPVRIRRKAASDQEKILSQTGGNVVLVDP